MTTQTIIERLAEITAYTGVVTRLETKAHAEGNTERLTRLSRLENIADGMKLIYDDLLEEEYKVPAYFDQIRKVNRKAEELDGIIRMQLFVKNEYRMACGPTLYVDEDEAAYLLKD